MGIFLVRPILVLLALLSLAVRWGDAACGCAAHNHWASPSAARHDEDHGHNHDHESPDGPAIGHGCAGEAIAAVYPAGVRTLPAENFDGPSCGVSDDLAAAQFAGYVEGFSPSGPPSRAALNVYRI
ncbi:MAG: hypothetical protein WBC44_21570 [Planctomycetaceae bacterium]